MNYLDKTGMAYFWNKIKERIPTKTSELTNDSNYITSESDPTVPQHVKNITEADISKWNNGGSLTGDTLPIGAVMEWFSDVIPTNWLLLNGQAISRTGYSELFALYGTTFGAGDGSKTFNLPDMRTRVPVGKDSGYSDFDKLGKTGGEKTHTLTVDEMPEHNHSVGSYKRAGTQTAFSNTASGDHSYPNGVGDISIGNTGGSQPHNNLQPYTVTHFIVKAKQSAGVVANVVDNLESTSTTDALSAKQGNILNDKIEGETLAFYENGGTTDANTTIEPLILTKVNAPTTDFWYIKTLFYGSISNTSNRKQIAYSYKFDAPIYTRYCISGTWSEWTTGEIKSSNITDYEGHIWFKNGMLLQWGQVIIKPTAANTVTSAEITFPQTYDFAPFITASPQIAYPNACTCSVGVGSSTGGAKAGMKIYMTRTNTSETNFRWFAVGYKSA